VDDTEDEESVGDSASPAVKKDDVNDDAGTTLSTAVMQQG